jgi:hypothetical protein
MPKTKAPWWMYVVACSYVAIFCVSVYQAVRGPEWTGVAAIQEQGRVLVKSVQSNSPASRAAIRPGDQIVAGAGHNIESAWDWYGITFNLHASDRLPVRIVRDGLQFEPTLVVNRRSWRSPEAPGLYAFEFTQFAYLAIAFVIAFSRPFNTNARLGAWFLAAGMTPIMSFEGFGAVFRSLPAVIQGLLWVEIVLGRSGMVAFLSFCAMFPRPLFRARWALVLCIPALAMAPFELAHIYRASYLPGQPTGTPAWLLAATPAFWMLYLPAGLVMLILNYRRSAEPTERRRIRVLLLGLAVVAFVTVPMMLAQMPIAPRLFPPLVPVSQVVASISALALPASFAYAILRHRLFDIRVIIRQGLQHAIARNVLLLLTPALAAMLAVDLLFRGQESLMQILRERGWIYLSLAALATWLHLKRTRWLTALDRRFFREQYNAQQVLGVTVREVRAARTEEEVAPRIVTQIDLALHPAAVGIFHVHGAEPAYRVLASSGMAAPVLPAGARMCRILQALGKPLEIGDRSSLRKGLPESELEFLRCANVEWLFPVSTSAEACTAFLTVGPKRSAQPYIPEDIDLLQAITDSLGLLFERGKLAAVQESSLECPSCGRSYDPGAVSCDSDASTLLPAGVPRLIQGRFKLERRIGQGGMGVVYEATDVELDRHVAIKFLRDQRLGDAPALSRFRREARVLASFQHPNVVTIFDAGSIANGRGFLVMELLRGAGLSQELATRGTLPVLQIVDILRGVCSAVEGAHRRSIVHRDLKPQNVFLAEQAGGVVPKVLDFGLAALIDPDGTTLTLADATGAGGVAGTPGYIAPERLLGQRGGEASDIWSIGVIAYEMLTGRHPIAGGRLTPVTKHIPDAPARWQSFFARALADRPEERPPSAQVLFSEFLAAFRVAADAATPR